MHALAKSAKAASNERPLLLAAVRRRHPGGGRTGPARRGARKPCGPPWGEGGRPKGQKSLEKPCFQGSATGRRPYHTCAFGLADTLSWEVWSKRRPDRIPDPAAIPGGQTFRWRLSQNGNVLRSAPFPRVPAVPRGGRLPDMHRVFLGRNEATAVWIIEAIADTTVFNRAGQHVYDLHKDRSYVLYLFDPA
jgi:hypothetical protein